MAIGRIMIADDEPAVAAFVRDVAVRSGYDAETVSRAAELREQLARPDITHIFLDLNMPGLDGIEALRYLADIRCQAQIVIFSGADGKVRDAARRMGIQLGLSIARVLPKPVRLADLRAVLTEFHAHEGQVTVEGVAEAIARGEMFLDYQPKVVLPSRELAGVEALVRWRRADGTLVMPGDFLPLIEGTETIDALTWSVVDQALAQIRAWLDAEVSCSVAVNLSARTLSSLELADELEARCNRHGVPPNLLTLELTETAAVKDEVMGIGVLTRLRLKGFGLSIDDFGTGFSSIAQLHRMPFDELKIDRCFVSELSAGGDASVIVKAMIDLAHNLDLRVCAEGVEDAASMEILHRFGCDTVQGYHIARPMRGNVIPHWTASRREPGLSVVSGAQDRPSLRCADKRPS